MVRQGNEKREQKRRDRRELRRSKQSGNALPTSADLMRAYEIAEQNADEAAQRALQRLWNAHVLIKG